MKRHLKVTHTINANRVTCGKCSRLTSEGHGILQWRCTLLGESLVCNEKWMPKRSARCLETEVAK